MLPFRDARRNPGPPRSGRKTGRGHRDAGFSLVELIVVMIVAVILTALLLPALGQIRDNAHRVISAANMRQQGVAFFMYAGDNGDSLPPSAFVDPAVFPDGLQPWELMAARHDRGAINGWDGVGLLFFWSYCDIPETFYSPSHTGEHALDRYLEDWNRYAPSITPGPIYTNYHYAGHLDWQTGEMRNINHGERLVLLTDGLRTVRDLNHHLGINVLRGDGSVHWNGELQPVLKRVPNGIATLLGNPLEAEEYMDLWDVVTSSNY